MSTLKTFVLVLLLVLGSSVSSGRYLEDSRARSSQYDDDSEEREENDPYERDMPDDEEEEEGDDRVEDDFDEEDNRDAREEIKTKEEVVKIRPEDTKQEDDTAEQEENSEDEGENEDFEDEDEVDRFHDDRMMDGDEGGMSLAGHEEENIADEGGFESFKKKVEEIKKESEKIQAEINDLEAKFDEALSSDSDNAVHDHTAEAKPAIQHDTRNSDQSVNTGDSDTPEDLHHSEVQRNEEDDLAMRYAEIGEDANTDPDDDY